MFRTELTIEPSNLKINHDSKIITVGSCFAQVIGEKLNRNKFDVLANPFGTVFNPISILRLLENAVSENFVALDSSVQSQGVWFNHHFHSDNYGNTKETLDSLLKEKLNQVKARLLQTDILILTFGTAFVYKLKSNNEVVANCHKAPSINFNKELLTVDEIVTTFTSIINQFKIKNLKFKIIITVSPVRHTKDTLSLNSVSKSILRLACHELSKRFPEVIYFPAYEIMMDDLRDYRFYKEDMIHPTEVAEDYIWNKFSETYFNENTKSLNKEWESISKALQHKPFREDSEEYKKFLSETLKKLEALDGKLDVRLEIEQLRRNVKL